MTDHTPYTKLELRTAYGPVYRNVLKTPPRDARDDEVPVIDLKDVHGNHDQRKSLSQEIRHAAENTGFFYIKNHGVTQDAIAGALSAAKLFFHQPDQVKFTVSKDKGKFFNGWSARRSGAANEAEGQLREAFMWRYQPEFDPLHDDSDEVPPDVTSWLLGEQYIWDGTEHLPGSKQNCITYWQQCLQLSRKLVKLFALGLDLPEDYFDSLTTYPGSDGVFNYYPAMTEEQVKSSNDVGVGSHTDLQCFTLLWQDTLGGLQVLTNEGQWIKVPPKPGTFVVNIGDFLMRLTNDRFKSTVHRAYNKSTMDRYSMPFFFGFNFNEKCSVLPKCTDEDNPAKYDPISCGPCLTARLNRRNELELDITHPQESGCPLCCIREGISANNGTISGLHIHDLTLREKSCSRVYFDHTRNTQCLRKLPLRSLAPTVDLGRVPLFFGKEQAQLLHVFRKVPKYWISINSRACALDLDCPMDLAGSHGDLSHQYHIATRMTRLKIIVPSTIDLNESIHDVAVTFDLEDYCWHLSIKHDPAFDMGGAHMRIEVSSYDSVLVISPDDTSASQLSFTLRRTIHPQVIDQDGKICGENSFEAKQVRVWCSIPLKALPTSTVLSFDIPASTPNIERLDALKQQNGGFAPTHLTAPTRDIVFGELSNQDSQSTQASHGKPPMWLDLRDEQSPSLRAKQTIHHSWLMPISKSESQRISDQPRQNPRHIRASKSFSAQVSENNKQNDVKKWLDYAATQGRPEGAISTRPVAWQGISDEMVCKEDYWKKEFEKTQWRNDVSTRLRGTPEQPFFELSQHIPNISTLGTGSGPSANQDALQSTAKQPQDVTRWLQLPLLEAARYDNDMVYNNGSSTVAAVKRTVTAAAEQHPITVSTKVSSASPSKSSRALLVQNSVKAAVKKRRGGALFDSI